MEKKFFIHVKSKRSKMKNVCEFLKKDNDEAKRLLALAINSLDVDPKASLEVFQSIKEELISHGKAEEDVLYKTLVELDINNKMEEMVRERKEEHHLIALVIQEMNQVNCHDPEWAAKLLVLSDLFDHHVKSEEGLFNKAQEIISKEKSSIMEKEIKELKSDYRKKVDDILVEEVSSLFNSKDLISRDQISG